MIIKKYGYTREICVKCDGLANSVCPYCGTLCERHSAIHRHETGHIFERLNWEEHAQPNTTKVNHDER